MVCKPLQVYHKLSISFNVRANLKYAPYIPIALGCIRLFFEVRTWSLNEALTRQAAKDLWESYDIIKNVILEFNDIQNRIQLLEQVDKDLLLPIVYMEVFGYFIKFVAILTRYARDKKLGIYIYISFPFNLPQ